MESSKQRRSLFDVFRHRYVLATPEEMIRQKLLHLMTSKLGYPKQLIAVEKQLSELPHLKGSFSLPKRRADIICFAKEIHPNYPLYPLLLIECKEGKIGKKAKEQVLGYNHFVQAYFVAIAGKEKLSLVFPQELAFLPSYSQLMEQIWACK